MLLKVSILEMIILIDILILCNYNFEWEFFSNFVK